MISKLSHVLLTVYFITALKTVTTWSNGHRIIAVLVILGFASCVLGTMCRRTVVVNTSPSVQPGIYIRTSESPEIGSLIDFRIPERLQPYIQSRTGERGNEWFIIKPVVAGPGDEVDTTGDHLAINGRLIAPIHSYDADGRELPIWREHRKLRSDEYFVFSARIPNSLDSRYFGPICRRDIDAVRRCIFAWAG